MITPSGYCQHGFPAVCASFALAWGRVSWDAYSTQCRTPDLCCSTGQVLALRGLEGRWDRDYLGCWGSYGPVMSGPILSTWEAPRCARGYGSRPSFARWHGLPPHPSICGALYAAGVDGCKAVLS